MSNIPNQVNNVDNHAKAASYSPYDVNMYYFNKKTKANRSASFTSGKKLVYDVYKNDNNKGGWAIKNRDYGKGKQPYLEFTGWSAIVGYHNHYSNNQDTYIWLKNKYDGRDKVYKAEMLNYDASKDLEYNRQSKTGPINNPCSDSVYNARNDKCNMYYKSVGFRAHIPLNELFPKGKEKTQWVMYIVKRVGSKVLYDELRVPFQFSDLEFGLGKINLTSGIDAEILRMNTGGVARRTKPRESGYSGKYFTKNKKYQKRKQDQSWVVVWYGVVSPEDGGAIRWAASPYWTFGGEIATLSYQINKKECPDGSVVNVDQACTVKVTIYHKDAETGKILRTDNKKATVGKTYTYKPEPKGTFKDANGNPYVATPTGQKFTGTVPSNNMTFTFTYKTSKPDPSTIKEMSGATEGKAQGNMLWRLKKDGNDSVVYLENSAKIAGKHFATRNVEYDISSTAFSENDNIPQSYIIDPNVVKNKEINYSFSYEYTNYYRENYKCVEKQGSDCFKWQFVNNTPVWDDPYKKTAVWNVKLVANHHEGETFVLSDSQKSQKLLVGQTATLNGDQTAITKKDYYESFSFPNANDFTYLYTQSWLSLIQDMDYQVDYPDETLHYQQNDMNYYPVDLDKNLRDKYENNTPYGYSDYAIPLSVNGTTKNGQVWHVTFGPKDDFYLTKDTGFLFSVPKGSNASVVNNAAKTQYENYTKTTYDDTVLMEGDHSRYYLPIDGNSELKPNEIYENEVGLGKLGLSDVTFHFGRKFSFQKYLIGSVFDDPVVNEQHESTVKIDKYPHTVYIPYDDAKQLAKDAMSRGMLLHSFRTMDGHDLYQKVSPYIQN